MLIKTHIMKIYLIHNHTKMPEVKGVSKETIVKVQLNTGKVIEAQRSASEIAEDINN
jgi:hypothetical protein